MALNIIGAKYAIQSLSAVGTTTATIATATFVSGDFSLTSQRMAALFTSAGAFKGIAWVRRFISTTQVELENRFVDPCTGLFATQLVGDQILISKNFAESAGTGFAVNSTTLNVTMTDHVTFGTAGSETSVCVYDERYDIASTNAFQPIGGVTVLGKLISYDGTGRASFKWARDCSIKPRSDYAGSGAGSVPYCVLPTGGTSAHFFMFGGGVSGTYQSSNFIGAQGSNATNKSFAFFGTRMNYITGSPSNGGAWASNATRHVLYKTIHEAAFTGANLVLWGDGISEPSFLSFPQSGAGSPFGVFRAPGVANIGSPSGQRTVVNDLGTGSLIDAANNGDYRFTNVITPSVSIVRRAANIPIQFSYSDDYTNLQSGSTVVVRRTVDSVVAASVVGSSNTFTASVLQSTYNATTNGTLTPVTDFTSYDYTIKDYGFNAVSGNHTVVNFPLGTGGTGRNLTLGGLINQLPDTGVTRSLAAALALTTIATLDDLYDATIAWAVSSAANAQYPSLAGYPATRLGAVLDFGAISLVIDATAAAAFAINTSTNTITIKASTLTKGTKFLSVKTTGTVTLANGAVVSVPYQDSTGVRATIAGLDPASLGTTWALGYITSTNYNARTANTAPNSWTGWAQTSGTGNSTQLTLAAATEYQLWLRIPGYPAPIGPIATIDTATQTSITLSPVADTDLTGALLWPQTANQTTQAGKFSYNTTAALVEYDNRTGATEYITFLAAYRALETIAKSPSMAYALIQPLYLNGTKDGFALPRSNPLLARMTAASTAGAILQADISYADNQAKAFDRFRANSSHAYTLLPQASATLTVSTIQAIQSGLATTAQLSTINAGVKKASLLIPHTVSL
jgi:hypothetical protein